MVLKPHHAHNTHRVTRLPTTKLRRNFRFTYFTYQRVGLLYVRKTQ